MKKQSTIDNQKTVNSEPVNAYGTFKARCAMPNKRTKKQLESLGERVGGRVGQGLSKNAEKKGADIGKKVGKALGEQVGRLHDALEKEPVTKKEQLGIGGKMGTGLGVIAKHLIEKRYGLLTRMVGTGNLVAEGRTMGAKAEKIVKRAIKTGVQRIARVKGNSKEGHDKGG